MSVVEKRLAELGVVLPSPVAPVANYVPYVRTGNLVFIAGQVCLDGEGKVPARYKGKLGEISDQAGMEAARASAINVLAQLKAAIIDLDKVARCVRLCGYINSKPDFGPLPQIMNGASDLVVQAFGDKGRHARTTIGVAQLPLDCAVEVDGIFEVS